MLTTLPKLKTFLGIDTNDDDDKLYQHLKSADAFFKSETQRTFEQTTYTEYYDGDGSDELFIDHYPIISVTSIYDDLDRDYEAEDVFEDDDYMIYEDQGMIKLDDTYFQDGSKNVKITYSAGYAAIPNDIQMAVVQLAAAAYLEAHGTVAVIEGNECLYKPGLLRKEAQKTINHYRKVR
jgi:uncharacterized phiE125 gp8 family phage protein